ARRRCREPTVIPFGPTVRRPSGWTAQSSSLRLVLPAHANVGTQPLVFRFKINKAALQHIDSSFQIRIQLRWITVVDDNRTLFKHKTPFIFPRPLAASTVCP